MDTDKMHIALLVPVCSRNQTYTSIEDTPFMKYLYPSFKNTIEDGYIYTFYIGYDDDDVFYENNNVIEGIQLHKLTDCQHAPATAWNKLADISFNSEIKHDYFFQIGDDVVLETPGWTSHFISRLKDNNNVGIVGPCHINNLVGRQQQGKPFVIENAFVSRKHLETFGYFFHPLIKNWYCDDWITRIYDHSFSEIQVNYTCKNAVMDRYRVENPLNISEYILEGQKTLNSRRVLSYCVFGDKPKYCLGMVKNLEQIKVLFPGYNVWIYLGNDVPQKYIDKYNTFENVTLIHNDFTGGRLMAHRYFVLENDFDFYFMRDADSRFGDRDLWCIQHFLRSPYNVFTIRDHPYHMRPLMGGQTGFKNVFFNSIKKSYVQFETNELNPDRYQNDQDFIERYIFTSQKDNTVAYSEFSRFGEKETLRIPIPRKSDEDFCGNVYLFDGDREYAEFKL